MVKPYIQEMIRLDQLCDSGRMSTDDRMELGIFHAFHQVYGDKIPTYQEIKDKIFLKNGIINEEFSSIVINEADLAPRTWMKKS